jgi:hypothetical protein
VRIIEGAENEKEQTMVVINTLDRKDLLITIPLFYKYKELLADSKINL